MPVDYERVWRVSLRRYAVVHKEDSTVVGSYQRLVQARKIVKDCGPNYVIWDTLTKEEVTSVK